MTLIFAVTAMAAFRNAGMIALAMTLSAVIATGVAVVALTRHSRTSSRILKKASAAGPQRNHEDAARGRVTF
jgi:membrane protein implicated in regulation of membrane protease activity